MGLLMGNLILKVAIKSKFLFYKFSFASKKKNILKKHLAKSNLSIF